MKTIHPEINKQQKCSLFTRTALAGLIVTELNSWMFRLNHLRQLAHTTDEDVTIGNIISKSPDCFLSLLKYNAR